MSVTSVSTSGVSKASQHDKYGRLFEKVVVLGLHKHLGVSAGTLELRPKFTDKALLDRTRQQLSPALDQLFRITHDEWKRRTNQTRRGAGGALGFQTLEADIWAVIQLEEIPMLPVRWPSFTALQLQLPGDAASMETPSGFGTGQGLLICEVTSSADMLCLQLKLCKLERLLAYAELADVSADMPFPGEVVAALATEAAADSAAKQLAEFVRSNTVALPRLASRMAAGRFIFIDIPVTIMEYVMKLQDDMDQLTDSHEKLSTIVQQLDEDRQQLRERLEEQRAEQQQERLQLHACMQELMARLSAVEAAGAPPQQHVHLHIDSNVPVPLTMAFAGPGAGPSEPGTGVVLMASGMVLPDNVTVSTSFRS